MTEDHGDETLVQICRTITYYPVTPSLVRAFTRSARSHHESVDDLDRSRGEGPFYPLSHTAAITNEISSSLPPYVTSCCLYARGAVLVSDLRDMAHKVRRLAATFTRSPLSMVMLSTPPNPYKYCVDSMVILTNPHLSNTLSVPSYIHRIFAFGDRGHEGSIFSHHPYKSQIRTEVSRNGALLFPREQVPPQELGTQALAGVVTRDSQVRFACFGYFGSILS